MSQAILCNPLLAKVNLKQIRGLVLLPNFAINLIYLIRKDARTLSIGSSLKTLESGEDLAYELIEWLSCGSFF